MPIACLELRIVYSSYKMRKIQGGKTGWARERAHLTRGIDDVTFILDAVVVDGL